MARCVTADHRFVPLIIMMPPPCPTDHGALAPGSHHKHRPADHLHLLPCLRPQLILRVRPPRRLLPPRHASLLRPAHRYPHRAPGGRCIAYTSPPPLAFRFWTSASVRARAALAPPTTAYVHFTPPGFLLPLTNISRRARSLHSRLSPSSIVSHSPRIGLASPPCPSDYVPPHTQMPTSSSTTAFWTVPA